LFIDAEGSHLMIKYTLTSLSSKVDREYNKDDILLVNKQKGLWPVSSSVYYTSMTK